MSGNHGIKGRASDEVLRAVKDQCILWEKGAPVGVNMYLVESVKLFTSTNYLCV